MYKRQVYKEVEEPDWLDDRGWIKETIYNLGGSLTLQERRWLLVRSDVESSLPYFKLLPKVHKSPVLGRPIVPSFDTFYTNASIWVAEKLKVIIKDYPWILKDTTTFLQTLPMKYNSIGSPDPEEDIWLISGDVEAMYPSIPTDWGLECMANILKRSSLPIETITLVLKLLEKILRNNYFTFMGKYYLQVKGTAMGTSCAPMYANLVMAEAEYTGTSQTNSGQGQNIKYYGRYLDDIFVVVRGNKDSPQNFIDNFESEHSNFKFTWNVSKSSMTFLDVEVVTAKVKDNIQLLTKTYQKPMNAYQYIPWSSYHPLHVKKAWIKAELLRHVRNCSELNSFLEIRKKFYLRLRARGYPHGFLNKVFLTVDYQNTRAFTLTGKTECTPTEKDKVETLIFKSTYNPLWEGTNMKTVWDAILTTWESLEFLPTNTRVIHSQSKPPALGDLFNRKNKETIERFKDNIVNS